MSRALVVYESLFRDAAAIAHAIAAGLSGTVPADVGAAAGALADVGDLHAGLREWSGWVHVSSPGLRAAAFDSRDTGHPTLTRSDHAARTEEKRLSRLGAEIIAPAEHFAVTGTRGLLAGGEEERARAWGRTLGERLTSAAIGHQ